MIDLHAYTYNFKLAEPLAISFHTFYYRENVLITLDYNGVTGTGEAAPFKPITGDDQQDVLNQAKQLGKLPLNPKKDSLKTLHEYLDQHNITSHTLRTALDFAYHDLVGRLKEIPVYQLYAPKPTPIDNCLTVFVHDTEEETVRSVKALYARDPKISILKIKLKGDGDIERAKVIKKVSPDYMRFTLDANQGFTDPKEAVRVLTKIQEILGEVILVEEPCPKGELEKLKYVTENIQGTRIFADESAATLEDARNVVKARAAHGVNIKLEKAGGIWPSKQIAQLCIDNGLEIMVGCMLEGPFALAAGTHFAVSTPNLILTDLDGDSDMPMHTDSITPSVNGQRVPLEKSGFGITLDMQKLEQLNKTKEAIFEKLF